MSRSLIASNLEEKIQAYREQQFTGLVKVSGLKGNQWFVYYLLGRIAWTKSRTHSLRRWKRHLAIHSPAFFDQITQPANVSYGSWNYTALARLVKLKQFRQDQFSKVVESCITEDLFDILQVGTLELQKSNHALVYEAYAKAAANLPFITLHQELAWQNAQQEWQAWEQAGLANFSPDWVPVITQLETLKVQTPPQTFRTLTTFINGKNTLRDLAIKFNQPIIPLVKSILPYVSRQMLGLSEIPDIVETASDGFDPELTDACPSATVQLSSVAKSPSEPTRANSLQENALAHNAGIARDVSAALPSVAASRVATSAPAQAGRVLSARVGRKAKSNAPQIVYIDDSPADSRIMAEIVESLGYQYTNVPDPLQALPMLIELKPKLIFLDLVMPIANGYEVCSQIRRISAFKNIPVVIVTSNDGIADRVRARIVGASGFLGKPIQHKKVSKVLKKHLRNLAPNSSTTLSERAFSPL